VSSETKLFGCRAVRKIDEACRISRGADGHDRLGCRDVARGREDRRAAQAVADKQAGRAAVRIHVPRRGEKILDIGREAAGGELAFALAEPGEVKAKDRHPALSERPADAHGGLGGLVAGEAVGE
jgi:hypothetical protein